MDFAWPPAPNVLDLADEDVHVWGVDLAQPPHVAAMLGETLSDDEHARAARFHFARDRRYYIVGRGVLRRLLAQYSATDVKALHFTYNAQGKPALDDDTLQFNLSNSGEMALIAFTLKRRIGVDVEFHRAISDMTGVARSSFSAAEFQQWARLPANVQAEAFFNCWTCKEAYIKAIGEGFSHPLDSFDVAFVPGETPRFLRIARDPSAVDRWSLRALAPHPNYTAAVAVEGTIRNVICWRWQAPQ